MIAPKGKLEAAADILRNFGAENNPRDAHRSFVIGRRFYRRLRNPSFVRSVTTLVAIEGERTANGWLVMEAQH
jgi:hypothetical protein